MNYFKQKQESLQCEGGQLNTNDSNQNQQKFNKNATQKVSIKNLGLSIQDEQYGPKNIITTPQNQQHRINQFKSSSNHNLNKIYKSNLNMKSASGVSIFKDPKNPQKTFLRNQHKMSVASAKSTNSRFNFAIQNINQRPNNNPFNDIASYSSNGLGQILGLINQTNKQYQSGTTSQGPQAPLKVLKAQGELQDEIVQSTPLVTGEDEDAISQKYQEQFKEINTSIHQGFDESDEDQKYLQNFQDKLSSKSSQNYQNDYDIKQNYATNSNIKKIVKNEEDNQKTLQKAIQSDINLGQFIQSEQLYQKVEQAQKQFVSKIPKIHKNNSMKLNQISQIDKDQSKIQKTVKPTSQKQNIINNNITVTNFIIQQDSTLKKQVIQKEEIKTEQQPFLLDQQTFNLIKEENLEESTFISKIQSEKQNNEKPKKVEMFKNQTKQNSVQLQKLKQVGEVNHNSFQQTQQNKKSNVNEQTSPVKNNSAKYNLKSSRKSQANPKISDKLPLRKYSILNEQSSQQQSPNKVQHIQDSQKNEKQKQFIIDNVHQNIQLNQNPIIDQQNIQIQRNVSILEPAKLQYPLSSEEAINNFKDYLNDYEIQEIQNFNNQIYYVGQNCKRKIKGYLMSKNKSAEFVQRHKERLKQMNIFNHGFDDDQGDYQVILKDHLAYRYEVLEFLGQGSFGQAIKCLDHKTQELYAIKIIRNKKKFQYQASVELRILKFLNYHDKYDQNNVIRVKNYAVFRKHLLIAFECLSVNLYEFIKNNNFQGVSLSLIRRFAIQILQALKYQKDHRIIHCDLKPENILLKQENKSGIKIIDYGSSCFIGQRIYTYIQSRFYRAPEIILGIPYTMAIDMWSFGCIIAELYTGYPIFPGESEVDQLAYIMEICGKPPRSVLQLATRKNLFFDSNDEPIAAENSRGKIRLPNQKTLAQILKISDKSKNQNQKISKQEQDENQLFLDFLQKCFEWHPVDRMTPLEALHHDWILQGLPEKVLLHHMKMFMFPQNNMNFENKSHKKVKQREDRRLLEKATISEIQGFPPNVQTKNLFEMIEEIKQEERDRDQRKKLKEEDKKIKSQESNNINEIDTTEQINQNLEILIHNQQIETKNNQQIKNKNLQETDCLPYNQSQKLQQIIQYEENKQEIKMNEKKNKKQNLNEQSPSNQIKHVINYDQNYRKSMSSAPSIDQDVDKKQSIKIISKNEKNQKITFLTKGNQEQKKDEDEEDTIEDEFTELSKQGKSGRFKSKKEEQKQKSQMSNENHLNQRMQVQSQIISQVDSESLQKTNQIIKEKDSKDSRKLNHIENQVLKNQQIFQNMKSHQMNEVNSSSSSSTPLHPSQESSPSSMQDMSEHISKTKYNQSIQNQMISKSNFGSNIINRHGQVAVGGVTKKMNNYSLNSFNLIKGFERKRDIQQSEQKQELTSFQNFIEVIRGSFTTKTEEPPLQIQKKTIIKSPIENKQIGKIRIPQNIYLSQKGDSKQMQFLNETKIYNQK